MKPNKLALAIACIATSSATVASIDSDTISGSSGAIELEPIIVTATRTEQTADQTLASVTVITRQDIERQQAQSVQDVLRGVSGISIVNSGGMGKATSVFLRGSESDHVLVLIDGIKVGSATSGTTAFEHLPIEQIERIEVVRGPRSSLYGSEAIGGVIQVFTRKGAGSLKPSFSIGGGSYGTGNASAGVSGGGDQGWFSLNVSGIDNKGFNACEGKPFPDGAACFTIEPDKDGYQNISGSARAGYRFKNGLEVDLHALHTTSEVEFDGGFQNESETAQKNLGGTVRFSPTDVWQVSLTGGRNLDESENLKDGVFSSRFNTERNTVTLLNDIAITDDHLLTLGGDYQGDRIDSTTNYVTTTRNNRGVFVQYQGSLGTHDLEFSLRKDDNSEFDQDATGGAAWGYTFENSIRVTAAYGTAFKAPNFNELYWPADPVWGGGGNPDLKPEKARSVELGLSGKMGLGVWEVNAYETRVDELIANDATFTPRNIEQARIRGVETMITAQLAAWNLSTNLTLLDPKNDGNGVNNGNDLARRAKQSLRFDADRSFEKLSVGATLFAKGSSYDDLANTRELSGYGTVDLRAEYRFSKDWRVQVRLENLLDKEYEVASFYNQPGRSLYVTLRYQP